ncbi:MAG: undecaprenyldiphospho-muramoylpentapeptide beta-N-acetylglucosaminyltransferase [Bacilli bacterium]|nr:undecaprenyldiphospho-muramoylpentapeptide beta-N-acetylglucosaminyltransferase [Bacilli bacterium]MDD3304636.1 undecaprenyldiphospho-muramoylpentapeptide beta-N-acetylglucosaminyltransferase [Bacilli bacterium]MDD4053549.1 undecaprenyldiphospho-muramoylpentapeptide beta-N-acetylglucosaminyltransferase [Bacilli bacterium]MDD4411484.1 undecaprenyldiphospho-muramoylpentapeptide beta-N-acetylglucosaminyltransferase [Bacilli bacterium]
MRVIVSAGGTGGHIYPALAIINKIRAKEPDSEFLFIGTHNRMEKDIVPKYSINYVPLTIVGIERKHFLRNIKTLRYFLKSIKDAKKIIKEFNPDIVIGVGGYVTAPVIYAAKKLGYKTLIHEQNSVLGLSNRFLLKYADVVAISFESTINYINDIKKVVFTGNPCSEEALKKTKMNKSDLGLLNKKKLVLIVMGSLGSVVINNKMKLMLSLFNNKDYEVLFITGKNYYEDFKDLELADNIKIVPYVDDMSRLMKATDLMISRAGATTMSEIIALKVPSILIPSPHVTNNHQLKNAMDLQDKGAALLIEEKDLEGDVLVRTVDKLLNNETKYNKMKKNLSRLVIDDSATRIYNTIRNLISGRKDDEKHNK